MVSINQTASSSSSATPSLNQALAAYRSAKKDPSSVSENSTQVHISPTGKALSEHQPLDGYNTMLQRVFYVTSKADEPPVATVAYIGTGHRDFLRKEDRQFLANTYQFAAENGDSLKEVDALAFDLAGYRYLQATGNNIEHKPGDGWNTDGSPHYWKMDASDITIGTRILTSKSAPATSMDHGFIAYLTNPRGGGWISDNNGGHAVSFTFLEKLVDATGGGHGESVESASVESGYKNSLYWINHLDVPDLPPEGYVPPGQVKEVKRSDALTMKSRSELDADFLKNVLDLLNTRGHANPSSPPELSMLHDLVKDREASATPSSILLAYLQKTSTSQHVSRT